MKRLFLITVCCCTTLPCFCWGFYGHQRINYYACFLLPPEMLVLYKPNINFLSEHAVDPDKRRYAVADEGPRHYIDIDQYGVYPFADLPHQWKDAVAKYGEDSLKRNGIVPWHIQVMLGRLTKAFKEKNFTKILVNSADIGHYIADSHVPLHASSNHNGQRTNQRGIHGFWESRVPELLAEKEFDFMVGKAVYIPHPLEFTWERVLESARATDSVLRFEKVLTAQFDADKKYAFETRNGLLVRQYSSDFTRAYNHSLNGMVERRMRQAIFAVASFWYTAWVNAGQPSLKAISQQPFSAEEAKQLEALNAQWQLGGQMMGRPEN